MKREDFKQITDEHFKTCEEIIKNVGVCSIIVECEECPFSHRNATNEKRCNVNWGCAPEKTLENAKEFLKFKPSRLADVEEKYDAVNKPNHYQLELNGQKLEVKDLIKSVVKDMDGTKGYYVGNVIKYILRAEKKNGLEDYKKAKRYLEFIIDEVE